MSAAYATPKILRQDCWPVVPDRLDDLGLPRAVVADLVLRYLWLHGSGTLALLNETLKLSFPVLEILFHQFRNQQLLEVKGMTGNDYSFSLTAGGRIHAAGRNEVCQYVGPAPVSIQQYQKVVKAQAAHVRLSRESLRQAFDDLVLPDGLLDQLGPALIGHQSLFLYGGTGNGKTSIAERILRIYQDSVVVPYAVEVDGHIITLFRSDRSPVPVPLRGHGKRQDQHRRAHPAHLSRRHCGALRGGSGRPHHHTIRPRGP